MSDNQVILVNNIISHFIVQLPEDIKTKIARASNPDSLKNLFPEIYDAIFNGITQVFDHLVTPYIDRQDYWTELIMELIHVKLKTLKGIDIDTISCYNYWITWKIQNNFKLLS